MNNDKLISIIIPVYNAAPYLRVCLDSVLQQTYTKWEAICVDDGSVDESGAILDAYAEKDTRLHVIHQTNQGASFARNVALELAQGEFIAFVDANDWLESGHLEAFMSEREVADVTFYPVCFEYPNHYRKVLMPQAIEAYDTEKIDNILEGLSRGCLDDMFGWTCNKIWRRNVVNGVRFPQSIDFYEDEIFALKACEGVMSVRVLEKPPYHYRLIQTGLTRKATKKRSFYDLAMCFKTAAMSQRFASLRRLAARQCPSFMMLHWAQNWLSVKAIIGIIEIHSLYPECFSRSRIKRKLYGFLGRLLIGVDNSEVKS